MTSVSSHFSTSLSVGPETQKSHYEDTKRGETKPDFPTQRIEKKFLFSASRSDHGLKLMSASKTGFLRVIRAFVASNRVSHYTGAVPAFL
jgi:hypothetical protein